MCDPDGLLSMGRQMEMGKNHAKSNDQEQLEIRKTEEDRQIKEQ